MRKLSFTYALLVLLVIAIASCSMPTLYRSGTEKIVVGRLAEKEFSDLKLFLQPYSNGKLQDTLIIKYEIDDESCWDRLDAQSDNYIWRVINGGKKYRDSIIKARPTVSFFHFQEKGKRKNKIISWDSTIHVDEPVTLQKMLFKSKAVCGSSAVILPNGEYIVLRSDSHVVGYGLSKNQIAEALKTKQIKEIIDRSGR
jgi:hypothetical protein